MLVLSKSPNEVARQSVLSGVLIGIGDIIYASVDNKYIGTLLFSFALLTIIHNGLPLYTGRIGFFRKYKATTLLQILAFNLIGVMIPVGLILYSKKEIQEVMQGIAIKKTSNGFLELFLLGALCGILMLIAVHSKKEIITVFCIMIFMLSGFEHCIAAFPYFMLDFSGINCLKFLCIVAGNSVGSILTYELIKKDDVPKKAS